MSNCVSNLSLSLPLQAAEALSSQPTDHSPSLSIDSPDSLSKNAKPSQILRNQAKKNQGKTAKKCPIIKKTIRKLSRNQAKQDLLLDVSGSTSTSNATPKVCQPSCEEYIPGVDDVQLITPESLCESSQSEINVAYLDGTLQKARLDEVSNKLNSSFFEAKATFV